MRILTLSLALLLAACGSSSTTGGPSTVPQSASSIAVSLQSPVIAVSKTTSATGSATLSTGSSQTITSGWKSDNPSVATVSDSGVVTGVANGLATIYVVFGGKQGQATLRVVPNYQGRWVGSYVVRSCTGILDDPASPLGFFYCSLTGTFELGRTLTMSTTFTQSGDAVAGQIQQGRLYTGINAPIDGGGAINVSSTASTAQETLSTTWRLFTNDTGQIVGTFTTRITQPNAPGRQTQLSGEIIGLTPQ